jgi:hypothetical protein
MPDENCLYNTFTIYTFKSIDMTNLSNRKNNPPFENLCFQMWEAPFHIWKLDCILDHLFRFKSFGNLSFVDAISLKSIFKIEIKLGRGAILNRSDNVILSSLTVLY